MSCEIKEKKKSKKRIEKVFLELLQKKDIEDISVTKICELAKVNRTTFYNNYIDIYDLLDSIKIDLNTNFINEMEKIYNKDDFINNERKYLIMFLEYIKENKLFYKNCLKHRHEFPIKDGFEILFENVAKPKFIKYGITNEEEMMYYFVYNQAGFTLVEKRWLENDCKESSEFIADLLLKCFNV